MRWLILVFLFGLGCAQVQPLTGGDEDRTAPVPLLNTAKPPMASTNIKPQEIRIFFDEYIVLKSPNTNVSIIPELDTKPQFSVNGKELIISLNAEELLENTTYSFVFNGAIADFNEGNDTTFTYVFATGPTIDSLSYSVALIDAITQKPVVKASVGLYVPSDTLNPYEIKPIYIAQTNNEGIAQFQYLRAQEFQVFAFLSEKGILTDDSRIAFLNKLIEIDTATLIDTMLLFQPEVEPKKPRVIKKDVRQPGRLELVTNFSFDPKGVLILNQKQVSVPFQFEDSERGDSCVFWFNAMENEAYNIRTPHEDTVFSSRVVFKKFATTKANYEVNLFEDFLEINDSLSLTFDKPIKSIDYNKLVLKDSGDSLLNVEAEIRNLRVIDFVLSFDFDRQYSFQALPNAFEFYDNTFYEDTISFVFKRKGENKYANLILELENQPKGQLVVRLMKKNEMIREAVLQDDTPTIEFKLLLPGEYTLEVVLDENANGAWDTGSFFEKRLP
jgi:hypothetical protein